MINTPNDWWNAVDGHWDNLQEIIAHNIDMCHPAYDVPGSDKSPATGRTISAELEHLKQTRDHQRLARYFHAAWGLASESYAWSVPSWGTLCDLCSEEQVFYQEEENG